MKTNIKQNNWLNQTQAKLISSITGMMVFTASLLHAQDPVTFTDDFEGPALNPFWSTVLVSGTITFPSSAQVHSGTQSLQVNSITTAENKWIRLRHTFNQPQYGQVSIWVYDSGADLVSGNYISLNLMNDTLGKYLSIGTMDYDLGPDNGGHYYYHAWDSQQPVNTPIDRTRAWHQFTLIANQNYASLYVDNQNIYNGPGGIPFESIKINITGPTWRPAMTVYFDDFTFSSAFPELSMRISQVEISWNSITNKTYKIQYRSEVTSNVWTDLFGPIMGSGTRNFVMDAVIPGQPRKFYRVIELP